jgi:hypothetical protein
MRKSICYTTRSDSNNSTKIVGGSFGGSIDQETVERLVNSQFSVMIKPSGRAVFVDDKGREVSLQITIDPMSTEKGKQAFTLHNQKMKALAPAPCPNNCEYYDCCDCGGNNCGCGGCYSCHVCEDCRDA